MLTTVFTNITVTFNGNPYTGDIQYDPAAHLLNLLHVDGEDEVLTATFGMFGLEPQCDTVFIQDGGVRRGLADSLARAGAVEILRSIQIGFDLRVVEVRVLADVATNVIDRITTKSGSVYEFSWDEPQWPTNGPRPGRVRKAGGDWQRIRMITPDFEVGSRMFFLYDDDSTVHTTRIASAETITESALAHAA